MITSCPHSLYLFRSDVDHFEFVDDFGGDKTAEELTVHPNPLLIPDNEGDYYRATQHFVTTEDYVEGPGIEIEAYTYVIVSRVNRYDPVTPIGSEDPSYERWYERFGTSEPYTYSLTSDVTVDPGKTYYEAIVEYKFDSFGENVVNTFRDWHIVPLGRPLIVPPMQKTMMVDVPGSNGSLDLSNSLTKYPVFQNRQGQIKFAVLNDYPEYDWLTIYTKMMKFLQGNPIKMIMEDDTKYFYEGSFWVDDWDSRNDGTWSEVTLGYDVKPYRRSIRTSIDDWLWDPFNFETDMVTDTAFNAIRIDSTDWTEKDFTGLIDMMPVVPELTVTIDDGATLEAQLYNSDLGLNWIDIPVPQGTTTNYRCVLSEATPESVIKMRFKGHGQVTIKFRSGRL